jgi:hypothetical protein
VGSSNNGKSTIFRALYWTINNRPLGKSVISYWNRDNKGDPVKPTKIELCIDDKTIIRGRDKDREKGNNYYSFDGVDYDALKGSIPEEIIKFINMSDVNIQRQKEQPFLISFTPGEAAKYLNSLIKLDVIDDCLTYVKREKTECESGLKQNVKELETLENDLLKLNWIDDADCLLKKVERLESERGEKEGALSGLSESINEYVKLKSSLSKFQTIGSAEKLIAEIRCVETGLNEKRNAEKSLSDSIERYQEAQKIIKKCVCVSGMESIITEIREIEKEKVLKGEELKGLDGSINAYEEKRERLSSIANQLVEETEKLPTICPVCGNKMKRS